MYSLAPHKRVPMVLWTKGIFMASFSWAILCYVVPCSVVLFPDESEKTIFHQLSLCSEKVIAFNSIGFQQLWINIFLMNFMLLCQQSWKTLDTKFPASQTLNNLLDSNVPYFNLCYHFLSVTHRFSLWAHLFFLYFYKEMQFTGDHYGDDQQCLCSLLENALPIMWHC